MSRTEMIQHLYDEINRQNTWYMWTIGALIAIVFGVVAFYSYEQWKFSDKGIKKMEEDFKRDFKIDENKKMLREIQSAIASTDKEGEKLKNEINKATDMNLENASFLLTYIDYTNVGNLYNRLINFDLVFSKATSTHVLSADVLQHIATNLTFCITSIDEHKIDCDEETNTRIERLVKKIIKQAEISVESNDNQELMLLNQLLAKSIGRLRDALKIYMDSVDSKQKNE
ncbi:hypothetical protein WJM93_03965 [Lactiplantibacillus plantarum]|uniref:hypothetical protein n=1 Tax=Lactiplantibacillus plantarum TaxID=1590 RepID=UPI0030B667EB